MTRLICIIIVLIVAGGKSFGQYSHRPYPMNDYQEAAAQLWKEYPMHYALINDS